MLFNTLIDPTENLLPFGGVVNDFGCIFEYSEAEALLAYFLDTVPWRQDEYVKTFNDKRAGSVTKHIITDRKVCWYADEAKTYTYAGSTKPANLWSPRLLAIKDKVEQLTRASYNACLLNLYHTGLEGMTWHSDSESDMLAGHPIASLSLGATRKFALKPKRKTHAKQDTRVFQLTSGQLIVMRGDTQRNWLHAVPKMSGVTEPRVNLTFRRIM